jgi:P-loop containing NTP hydrolase pore-1
MAYMSRLGLWGAGSAFEDFEAFLDSMKKRGVSFLEMLVRHCRSEPSAPPERSFPCKHGVLEHTIAHHLQAMEMKLEGFYVARGLSFRCADATLICCGAANSSLIVQMTIDIWGESFD